MTTDPFSIIVHAFVTEKTMAAMERDNKLVFVVRRTASKRQIKHALETLFDAKVLGLNTMVSPQGEKHAHVRFGPETKAEDIGMRVGIF